MTETTAHEHLNGHAELLANGSDPGGSRTFPSPPPSRPAVPRQQDVVLAHLRSGKSLTPQEAKDLYQIKALSAVVRELRLDGYDILTTRLTDGRGGKFARYSMLRDVDKTPKKETDREPTATLFDDAEAEDQSPGMEPQAAPANPKAAEAPTLPTPPTSNEIGILNIRLGPSGPEIQIEPLGQPDSGRFYRLSLAQIRYLSVNADLFADLLANGG